MGGGKRETEEFYLLLLLVFVLFCVLCVCVCFFFFFFKGESVITSTNWENITNSNSFLLVPF